MRHLFYQGTINDGGVRNTQTLLANAHREGEREVRLWIASHGGDVNAGVGLFNFIRALPMNIHTHAAGLCGSIAATIFLAGAERTAATISNFCLHAATFVDGPRAGEISPNTTLISRPFVDELGWSEPDISARFGPDEFHFTPEQAKGYGMAHDIANLVLGPSDEMIVVNVP